MEYQPDLMDGKEVPPLVLRQDCTMDRNHRGSIHVEDGHFLLLATHQGSLHLHGNSSAEIRGTHQGSVHVDAGCLVRITGKAQGSMHIMPGGRAVVEPSGSLAGSLHNDGDFILRGVFGGSEHGSEPIRVESGGQMKQPRIENGVYYYEW